MWADCVFAHMAQRTKLAELAQLEAQALVDAHSGVLGGAVVHQARHAHLPREQGSEEKEEGDEGVYRKEQVKKLKHKF